MFQTLLPFLPQRPVWPTRTFSSFHDKWPLVHLSPTSHFRKPHHYMLNTHCFPGKSFTVDPYLPIPLFNWYLLSSCFVPWCYTEFWS